MNPSCTSRARFAARSKNLASAQLTLSVPVSEISTDDESMAADHVTDHIVVVIHSVSMHGTKFTASH
jgi:hypothetical protein